MLLRSIYKWRFHVRSDLNLWRGFHQNDCSQTRFTVSPEARRELLFRLMELNRDIACASWRP